MTAPNLMAERWLLDAKGGRRTLKASMPGRRNDSAGKFRLDGHWMGSVEQRRVRVAETGDYAANGTTGRQSAGPLS